MTLDIETGDSVGMLVFHNEALIAVIAQLADFHVHQAGWWFAEFIFNPKVERPRWAFPQIGALDAWPRDQLAAAD